MKATSEEVQVFIAVVESGSFTRAAEKLALANSAVSRTVKKIEFNGRGGALLSSYASYLTRYEIS